MNTPKRMREAPAGTRVADCPSGYLPQEVDEAYDFVSGQKPRMPWIVERHDNDNGSIAYEVWTADLKHRVCRIVDTDNRYAMEDAHYIVNLHNARISGPE